MSFVVHADFKLSLFYYLSLMNNIEGIRFIVITEKYMPKDFNNYLNQKYAEPVELHNFAPLSGY